MALASRCRVLDETDEGTLIAYVGETSKGSQHQPLCQMLEIPARKIRRKLAALEQVGAISRKQTGRYLLITVRAGRSLMAARTAIGHQCPIRPVTSDRSKGTGRKGSEYQVRTTRGKGIHPRGEKLRDVTRNVTVVTLEGAPAGESSFQEKRATATRQRHANPALNTVAADIYDVSAQTTDGADATATPAQVSCFFKRA